MPASRRGTLSLSWGPWGGFYAVRSIVCWRVCLGWVAFTWLPGLEIETLMRAYVESDGGWTFNSWVSEGDA